MQSLTGRARSVLRLSQLVRERARFVARQAAGRRSVASYHLPSGPVAFHLRHRTDDVATLDQVVGQRHYVLPPQARQALDALDRPPEIVDLGANIGLFGVEMLNRFPRARVVAFEPDPGNAGILRRSVEANPDRRWELHEACAGVAPGEVRFAAGAFANSRIAEDGDGIVVPVEDVFPLLERADLVKIDIEGAEWPIVTDERFRRLTAGAIALEFHPYGCPEPDPEALAERVLREAGYEVSPAHLESLPGHGMVWAWKPA